MGFINERKNILRAEDGPLVAIDKNGNEVQIGNGSIACNTIKCGESFTFPFILPDEFIDDLMTGSYSLFIENKVGNTFSATIWGNYINETSDVPEMGEGISQTSQAMSGLYKVDLDLIGRTYAGNISYQAISYNDFTLNVLYDLYGSSFKISYSYSLEGGETFSQVNHNLIVMDGE